MAKYTVHLVCNAHIDPVWLWPWTAGLDEVLNTCHAVCELLDRNPDLIFTRGEAWVYEQIEKVDLSLFHRIACHVRNGRWEIVGGWYVQPDCNFPHEEGFRQQIELGRKYFEGAFGCFPQVAYNVDSFGHAAVLPAIMSEAGQRHYVMMRPQEHELELPARLFRWRGYTNGPDVLTFRIASAYATVNEISLDHVMQCLDGLPKGVTHSMCFIGIGDHGGGPTQQIVDWCRAHRTTIPDVSLEFSSPGRFFEAVSNQSRDIPTFTGELQHHAIGCYSIQRAIKKGVRQLEHHLAQAEEAIELIPSLRLRYTDSLELAWKQLCFNHFHDTLGGTCLPSTTPDALAQLGYGQTVAKEITTVALRTYTSNLPTHTHQRLIVANYAGQNFDGWLEHEPWLEWTRWHESWDLVDEVGQSIGHQVIPAEAVFGDSPRLLFRLSVPRRSYRVLRIAHGTKWYHRPTCTFQLKLHRAYEVELAASDLGWRMPEVHLLEDNSDTWGHGLSHFGGPVLERAAWSNLRFDQQGRLMCSWRMDGRIGKSRISAEVRRYANEQYIEIKLHVTWLEIHRVLQLVWPMQGSITGREDGVPGGYINRKPDGIERPVQDFTVLALHDGQSVGVVLPDTYSLSSTSKELRLTLLRSPVMAHHIPHSGEKPGRVISDQGAHDFFFRFFPLDAKSRVLASQALAIHRPPSIADVTRGMATRAFRHEYNPPNRAV